MGFSSFIFKLLAKEQHRKYTNMKSSALIDQSKTLKQILKKGGGAKFAKKLQINEDWSYDVFSKKTPITDYEVIEPYINKISQGELGVLTEGRPKYFSITSGTTSGTKYIPLTKKMLFFQIGAIKELLLLYAYQKNYYNISTQTGMMFIQGSPKLNYLNRIPFAKLSGITARHVPFFLKKNRYPSMKTNCIENWSEKIKKIVQETHNKDMRVIGGIPPWVMTYFDELLRFKGATKIKDVFPNLMLYIHGGSGFEPYKRAFLNTSGDIDTLEVYPASEGFFAYQDVLNDNSMLLLTRHGVFYEFIKLIDFQNKKFDRIPLEGVELNIDYVLIVSTIAGLWAYNTGDTVRFVSKNPYKILFSGRASQYCSTFGEHVIEKEVQEALNLSLDKFGGSVIEFTVCPRVSDRTKLSRHEWFVEFRSKPIDLVGFEKSLNSTMMKQNPYYKDLVDSGVISPIKLFIVKIGGFNAYMKSIGKFGGQNKCPHLSNNSKIGDFLLKKHVK